MSKKERINEIEEVRHEDSKKSGKKLSLRELVDARKQEMQSILPGFMTEVTDGKNKVMVESPSYRERSQFKVSTR